MDAATVPNDDFSPHWRVMEMLSEHQCEGCSRLPAHRRMTLQLYEAFIHIVDSMFNQHPSAQGHGAPAVAHKIASLNYLLASHVWRQIITLHAPGSWFHRPRHEQEAESCVFTCRRMRTACFR